MPIAILRFSYAVLEYAPNLTRGTRMAGKQSKNASLDKLNFEQAYKELETIVETMERGEQDLEKSLDDFERGVVLMKHCHSKLKDAEQKVEVLVKDNEGLFVSNSFDEE